MDKLEKKQKRKLAAHNAEEKASLEQEIFFLATTLRRWRYSVFYIVATMTIMLALQIYLIVR